MPASPTTSRPSRKRQNGEDRRSVQVEAIIDAALAEIDEKGLEAFSIRNLAARLNVYPAAIYWYLPNRDIILSHVAKRILTRAIPSDSGAFWRERLREVFVRFREAVRLHPNTAPLLGGTLIGNVTVEFELIEAILAIVYELGLREKFLVAGYNSIIAALVGFVNEEFAIIPTQSLESFRDQIATRLENIQKDKYPILSSNLPLLLNRAFALRWENGSTVPLSETFSYYIDVVISGLEGLAAQQYGRLAPPGRRE